MLRIFREIEETYYNDEISSDLDFMAATASDAEIERYSLKKWDIIIAKDSETQCLLWRVCRV